MVECNQLSLSVLDLSSCGVDFVLLTRLCGYGLCLTIPKVPPIPQGRACTVLTPFHGPNSTGVCSWQAATVPWPHCRAYRRIMISFSAMVYTIRHDGGCGTLWETSAIGGWFVATWSDKLLHIPGNSRRMQASDWSYPGSAKLLAAGPCC